jgi:hypothetical protein
VQLLNITQFLVRLETRQVSLARLRIIWFGLIRGILVWTEQASPELKAVISYLRGKTGPKSRQGVLNGKRVDYFKGESMAEIAHEMILGLFQAFYPVCSLSECISVLIFTTNRQIGNQVSARPGIQQSEGCSHSRE